MPVEIKKKKRKVRTRSLISRIDCSCIDTEMIRMYHFHSSPEILCEIGSKLPEQLVTQDVSDLRKL